MVKSRLSGNPLDAVRPVVNADGVTEMQREVQSVYVKDEVLEYLITLVNATRNHGLILRGASPRATLSLTAMAKAAAYMRGRDFVIPQDVAAVYARVVEHRLLLAPEASGEGAAGILKQILGRIPAPKV